jgi:hypothetical protein
MWSNVIVLLSPTRNEDFGFFQGEKDLLIEQFVSHLVIMDRYSHSFRAVRFDEQSFHARSFELQTKQYLNIIRNVSYRKKHGIAEYKSGKCNILFRRESFALLPPRINPHLINSELNLDLLSLLHTSCNLLQRRTHDMEKMDMVDKQTPTGGDR